MLMLVVMKVIMVVAMVALITILSIASSLLGDLHVLRWSAHHPCHQGWLRLAGPCPVVNHGAKPPIVCWLETAHVLSCVGGWQSW